MRALVIGLDGATFTVLTPLMQAGYMPNLQQAFAKGATGELLSTIPPVTALAWPSFMTGKNPGKHGLFGWQGPLNANFERPWVSGRAISGSKLWHLVNAEGLRTCVINVPVTYPPEPLDGAMVTGLLTPGLEANFTYPTELRESLLETVPDYQIDTDVQHTERDARNLDAIRRFLNEALVATQARGRAVHWLLEREQPDLAVAVFEMPDRLHHVLWRYVERLPAPLDGVQGADIIRQELLACYQALDSEIGQLIDRLPPTAHVVFLSDHGFGPLETLVHVNAWLAQQKWLTYDRRRTGGREILRRMGRRVKRWVPTSLMRQARQTFTTLRTLDWSRTWAYAGLPSEYGIFLNVRGREPAGIVEPDDYASLRTEIIQALREWHDPRTGQPIMQTVYRREELYQGPFTTHAPDIIFEFRRGYKVSHLPFQGELFSDVSQEPSGFHEREGIFAMSGPGIKASATVDRADIQDVMPTLLYTLGLPVPDDVDGRVLSDLFTPAWQTEHPVISQRLAEAETTPKAAHPYSVEEEALIAEHLRGLGYLE